MVLTSQVTTIAISALDFSPHDVLVHSQDSEEPKPKEGKNAFDFLEESKFVVADVHIFTFFFEVSLNTLHKESILFEVINTLESPPPELV